MSFVDKIDCSPSNKNIGLEFCSSLKQTGFAILNNTSISQNLIDDVLNDWKRFFRDTSLTEKNTYLHSMEGQTGYFPFKAENAKGETQPDLKEFFHMYEFTDLPVPHLPNPLKTAQLIYEMKNLGVFLLRYIADDIGDHSVVDTVVKSNRTLFRTLYYPALEEGQENTGLRAAAHEDINLITLLPAASESGLEVLDKQGNWHLVEYEEGDIVVNVADMLQMLTNYDYVSTTHRVQNPKDLSKDRVSMPLFVHASPEFNLGSMTTQEYLEQRLKEIGLK